MTLYYDKTPLVVVLGGQTYNLKVFEKHLDLYSRYWLVGLNHHSEVKKMPPISMQSLNTTIVPHAVNGTTTVPCATAPPCGNVTGNCLQSKPPYDYDGAMKFTVAVVLVYGIGVIGLLGIYTKRKRIVEDNIKEATTFVKTFEEKRLLMERKARKSAVSKLIQTIHDDEAKETSAISNLVINPCIITIGGVPKKNTHRARGGFSAPACNSSIINDSNDNSVSSDHDSRSVSNGNVATPVTAINEIRVLSNSDVDRSSHNGDVKGSLFKLSGCEQNTKTEKAVKEVALLESPECRPLIANQQPDTNNEADGYINNNLKLNNQISSLCDIEL
ncbi:hypothetical protein SNE40_011753 [Patella caerulea]|uniref:Uncharacterized protein n=1 Tax=Patella caerulea TaxID=87958 RepID=A0AAN8JPB1_PATCE